MRTTPRMLAAVLAAAAGLAVAAGPGLPVTEATASPAPRPERVPSPGPEAHGLTSAADHLHGRSSASVAAIARAHGVEPRVIAALAKDESAWFDRSGRAFFVEETAPAGDPAATGGTTTTGAAPYPYAQTFALHSRPGSNRTLYIDFDGATVAGTAWNTSYNQASVTAEPYDSDGNPASFSNAEQDVVQSVWQRVAEDYSSMDVDVTTQAPAPDALDRTDSTDQVYGTTALVSPTSFIYSSCSCGGMAYLGVFDWTPGHGTYQPAWVFTQGVGTGAKNIAEAVAHEVGHNLGLSHDGTNTAGANSYYWGQGHWAPIMGAGYNQPLTQFSNGDYTDANNQQDDFAVMAGHGAAQLADDYGDSTATAAPLTIGQNKTGLISSRSDVDYFSYSGDATASFEVKPAAVSPDLDMVVRVTSGGTTTTYAPADVRGSEDVLTGLGATFSVPADGDPNTPVYVSVEGTGEGDPLNGGESDYGSRGAYTIATNQPKVGVSASAWGYNNGGQLGAVCGCMQALSPYPVTRISEFTQIRAGQMGTIALKADGTVWAWGSNQYAAVSSDTSTSGYPSPVKIASLSGIKSVYAFGRTRFAVDGAGRVYGWGLNNIFSSAGQGQTGVGSTDQSVATPTLVPGLDGVVSMAGSDYASYALRSDGTVWAFGSGTVGRLGNGSTSNASAPVQVAISGVRSIAAGMWNGYALKSDGTVWAWGEWSGLAAPTRPVNSESSTPLQIAGLSGVKAIANGAAVKGDGTVWVWGRVQNGQLGNGTAPAQSQLAPAQVPGLTGIADVYSSDEDRRTLFAVTTAGTVWSWGSNKNGEVADGTSTDRTTPYQISGLSSVTSISADGMETFAIQP